MGAQNGEGPLEPAGEGLLLGGRYEVGPIIGAGGMGRVHEGRDRVLNRTVAIKMLDASRAREPRFVESLRSEARAAAALHHHSVVTVFDSGSEGDLHYIVMERLRGRTLRDLIAAEGPLEPTRARRIAARIAAALAVAHERGVVHRDVKPGNVMLCDGDRVKVMDFGIARAAGAQTRSHSMVLGTAAYLAPEQAQGRGVRPAADVYSLGCVLYEMLTGRPPFEGENPIATAYAHVHEAPIPPSEVADGIPPELERIVLRCLAKLPRRRFRTARHLEAALLGSRPAVDASSSEPVTEPMPPIARRRVPMGALGIGVILLAGFLFVPQTTSGPGPTPGRAEAATGGVKVPDVRGMLEGEATETLVDAGLVPRLVDGAVDDGVEDVVVRQDPAPGIRVEEGTVVTLRLSPMEPEGSTEPVAGEGGGGGTPAEKDRAQEREDHAATERPSGGSGGGGSDGAEEPSPEAPPSPAPEPTSTPTPTPTPTVTPAESTSLPA